MQRIVILGLMIGTVCFTACASNRSITIDSKPQGADVVADGRKIGTTPMQITPDEVFPPRWIGGSYMVKGKLELIEQNCEPLSMDVNDHVLSKPVNQELRCAEQLKVVPAAELEREPPLQQSINTNIELRLKRLKALHDKGLISEQEYQTQRQRILNEL